MEMEPSGEPLGKERDRFARLLQSQDVEQRQIMFVGRDGKTGSLPQCRIVHQSVMLAGRISSAACWSNSVAQG